MSRGRHLSLEEARQVNRLDSFAKEHASEGDQELFERLLDAMVHGEPPTPRRKREAGGASSAERASGSIGTRTRRGT